MSIQEYFINKKIKGAVKKASRVKREVSISKIETVLIFVDENSPFKTKEFSKLKAKMKLSSSLFKILSFKEKKSDYNEFQGVVIRPDSVDWRGNIKSEDAEALLHQKFDLFIDYTKANSQVKQLIVSNVKAGLKAGFSRNEESLYDIIIDVDPNQIELFNEELVRYLYILKVL